MVIPRTCVWVGFAWIACAPLVGCALIAGLGDHELGSASTTGSGTVICSGTTLKFGPAEEVASVSKNPRKLALTKTKLYWIDDGPDSKPVIQSVERTQGAKPKIVVEGYPDVTSVASDDQRVFFTGEKTNRGLWQKEGDAIKPLFSSGDAYDAVALGGYLFYVLDYVWQLDPATAIGGNNPQFIDSDAGARHLHVQSKYFVYLTSTAVRRTSRQKMPSMLGPMNKTDDIATVKANSVTADNTFVFWTTFLDDVEHGVRGSGVEARGRIAIVRGA